MVEFNTSHTEEVAPLTQCYFICSDKIIANLVGIYIVEVFCSDKKLSLKKGKVLPG